MNNEMFFDKSFSVIDKYGENLTKKEYVTNPAIAREEEIKRLIMILLTPEKSALLIGKAGIGKTAIVEGLAYRIARNDVPDALKGYTIIKINSTSLVGMVNIDNHEEMIIQLFVNELKNREKTIVFIDEIHTLIGGKTDGPMDLANILKPGLDRGELKVIGATTNAEYDAYIIRDRAFLRRFERIEVLEPDEETTTRILLESLPKIEKQTGCKFAYNEYLTKMLIESIVSATSEFKRVYGLSAMYPDVSFSVLSGAFSQALFHNKTEVDMLDVYNAIKVSKRIYPDSIIKELDAFKEKFDKYAKEYGVTFPNVSIDEIKGEEDYY